MSNLSKGLNTSSLASATHSIDSNLWYNGTSGLGTIAIDPNTTYAIADNWYSHVDAERFVSSHEKMLKTILSTLPFDELQTIIDSSLDLNSLDSNGFDEKEFIRFIVNNRVCPEEFLVKYYDYLTPEIIKVHHSQILIEKKYPGLLLKMKLEKKG